MITVNHHVLIFLEQKSASDVSNFDMDFTMEAAQLTPPDRELLKTINQDVFAGFSYTNAKMAVK